MLGLTQSYQAQQLGRLANEAGMAMAHASEGDNGGGHFRAFVEITIFMFSCTVTIFVMLSYGICLTFYGCTQRVRRSCRRMAAKLNCMARPDEDFGPLAPGAGASSARGPTSSNRTPIHYGDVTATTPLPSGSRSRSRSTSRMASRAVSRGKAIQSPETSGESDRQDNSEDEDPTFQVLSMSQMFDAPPGTQTQGKSSKVSMYN